MTWEETEIALQEIFALVKQLCDRKPNSSASKEVIKAWEEEMRPVRMRAIEIHYARIQINIQRQKSR
jgi:hypothetical protein